MPINTEAEDNNNSNNGDDLFHLLKKLSSINIGGRDNDGNPHKFFSDNDIAALQNTTLFQQLNTSEFKPGIAGAPKPTWASYLSLGSDTLSEQGLGFVKTEHNLTWQTDFTGTEAEIVRAREKAWAQAVSNAWVGFVSKWYIANDFANVDNGATLVAENGIVIDNALMPAIGGLGFVVGQTIPASFQGFNAIFNVAFSSAIDTKISSNAGVDPGSGSVEIKTFVDSLQTTSIAFTAGSESNILFKEYYKYFDRDTGELRDQISSSGGSIIDSINKLYAPDQANAFSLEDAGIKSIYDVYNYTFKILETFQTRAGQIVAGLDVPDGFIHKETNEIVEEIPEGDDPALYEQNFSKRAVYDEFTNYFIEEGSKAGLTEPVTTMLSGIMFNHFLIKNLNFTGLHDTPTGYQSGSFLYSTSSGIEYSSFDGTFTGLFDTPTGYVSGYYTRSSETGIEYISATGVADDIISSMTGIGGTYLKLKDTGTGIEFVNVGNIEGTFTGLHDTPTGYQSGYYLMSNKTGIEYISPTGLAKDIADAIATGQFLAFTGLNDTPTGYQSGYYLMSNKTGIEYISPTGLAKDIADTIVTGQFLAFTGLNDTPTGYQSGYYLMSNKTGIEYISPTGLAKDIANTIVTGQFLAFTGLNDTPTGYQSGYYLMSNKTGIEYISPTGLAKDIANTIVTGQFLAFTGLNDTPTGYQSGYYLMSNKTGIEYISPTGLAKDIANTIVTGQFLAFTGLNDTPTGYQSGYYLMSNKTGIEYISPTGLAKDIANTIATGQFLAFTGLNDTPTGYQSGYYLMSNKTGIEYISPTGLAKDIADTIATGQFLAFTGLNDTPTGYQSGYYLMSNKTGIEYISPTGLAKDIANTIVTGQFLAFTGLNDTPTGYQSGYYLMSNKTGIEYISPTGLAKDIADTIATGQFLAFTGLNDTPTGYQSGYYLMSNKTGIEYISPTGLAKDIANTIATGQFLAFTGLNDTPTGYQSGYYLMSNKTGIEYISPTGLAKDIADTIATGQFLAFTGLNDTPTGYQSGYYLMSNKTGIEYISPTGLAKDIADTIATGQFLAFTGLNDTPTGYQSGYYLISNETGIEYQSITGLADALIDYGFSAGGTSFFTGLKDTPTGYQSGYYLKSTETGIEYIDATGLAKTLPVFPRDLTETSSLPEPASDYDGEIIRVGCDLMISCDGEWKPLVSTDRLPLSEDERALYPNCVTTVGESLQYTDYIDTVLNENSALLLQASLNGQTVDDVLHEVCTFQSIDGQSNDSSSEGAWQNITTNHNFSTCAVEFGAGKIKHSSTWSTRSGNPNKLMGPGTVCEFNRDGTLMLVGWAKDDGTTHTPFIDVMQIVFNDQGVMQQSPAPVASLRSNLATAYWGASASISDNGSVIAVSDIGVTNTDGGHGIVAIYDLDLNTNNVTEKQIIRLPLTNSDYSTSHPQSSVYGAIENRTMNVSLSGDGKTLVVQFSQSYFDSNPKSIFIYNYNESTEMFELHQTINGIGFQTAKISKDGSTIVVACGFFTARSATSINDVFGVMDINTRTAYFHGLKILKRDSQNVWNEDSNLSLLDLGIQDAVVTSSIDWDLPISWALGAHLDINREGNAITFQLPDRLSLNTVSQSGLQYYVPGTVRLDFVTESTGPIGVITWDGQNWNRLGNFLFDNGDFGFHLQSIFEYGEGQYWTSRGGISDDGTLIMALSRNFKTDGAYRGHIHFIKWTGSAWEKLTGEFWASSGNAADIHTGGFCMSKSPHPIGKTIVGFIGFDNSTSHGFYFTEECSTNLVSSGQTSTTSPSVSSCGVVRIKETGYKWGLFPNNTQITVQAFPSTKCTFNEWTGGNVADPNSLETTLTITDGTSITGNFSVI